MKGEKEIMSETTTLASIVTSDMLKGVLNEIVGLLPVVIPVSISFLALRKGIAFVLSSIRRA